MVSILFAVSEGEREFLIADLMDAGTLGCSEEGGALRAFFEDGETAEQFSARYRVVEVRKESPTPMVCDPDSTIDPILIGERFFLVPPCSPHPTPPGRLRIDLHARTAFGSGRHESTQLMLRAMEPVTRPGMTIIDVGCGTGILSVAAHLLGAGREIACDIDPLFLHAIPSGLDGCVFVGSADAIRDHSADIVLANISAKVIDWIAYDLNRIARPNGIILISGFTRDMVPTRFSPLQELEDDDWLCWVCKPAFSGVSPPPRLHTLQWY